MRLKQIEKNLDLLDTLRLSTPRAMGRTETQQSIDDYYTRVLASDGVYVWYRNGVITNWQLAMDNWLADQYLPKLQRLDNRWRAYVSQLHYKHYLYNRLALTRLQIQKARQQMVYLKDELAETQSTIERYIGGNDNTTEQ